MGYFLADGIYPPYASLVQTFKRPTNQKEKLFAQVQEGARKDVERAFGVLQLRFAFVHTPAKLWSKDKLSSIMHSCIIMHNMIVEDERRDCDWREEYDFPPDPVPMFRNSLEQHYAIEARTMHMHDKRKHLQLRADLVEHVWEKFANNSV